MDRIHVFASFDLDHDADLFDLLLTQSRPATALFAISGRSQNGSSSDLCDPRLRSEISRADEVVVICGEHTHESLRVSAELAAAQEQDKPYLLLWGRRERMCTKPSAARPADSMYSWTPAILADQLQMTLRRAAPIEVPASVRGAAAHRKG